MPISRMGKYSLVNGIRKCHIQPSRWLVRPKLFLYAVRQPVVALRFYSPADFQSTFPYVFLFLFCHA